LSRRRRFLAQQVGAIEVTHLGRKDAVGEPGEDDDVKQLTEAKPFARIAQQDFQRTVRTTKEK